PRRFLCSSPTTRYTKRLFLPLWHPRELSFDDRHRCTPPTHPRFSAWSPGSKPATTSSGLLKWLSSRSSCRSFFAERIGASLASFGNYHTPHLRINLRILKSTTIR